MIPTAWRQQLQSWFLRFAAGGWLPARWFAAPPPPPAARAAREGPLTLEIVSHCWNYSHFLAYQLSSLVQFPPERLAVTMTVFHAPEDTRTQALLAYFADQHVPGVTWNWRELPREQLFRRGIGRNLAAQQTDADWIWFTDCDVMFRAGCLDALARALQGRRDALLFPREERITPLLAEDDPMLVRGAEPRLVDIDDSQFAVKTLKRATGPMQITHGDVARACGYCPTLRLYQTPADHFCKAYEDRAFRWLLGTGGNGIDVPGVYRIRHVFKGRYREDRASSRLRGAIRRAKSWLGERLAGHRRP
ncbi:glycosyltransferase family A protein [Algiphilus sp.]|uniref:glycosyltransferase family A protein n=1 Tax=Algiphilus sp. TaxID=1872431 RepID=UPI0025BE374E|nr:glycosyltransferase family A protein [Algiphilus sp.]MCK5771575.1 glycosyltransferase family 2 protein [Algiphilus sp.]